MHKQGIMPDDMACNSHPQKMGVQTFQLGCDHTDILAALRNFRLINCFHTHGIGKSMRM